MGAETKISWTDSTFNPWIGCTKVGPGCDNCYAEAQDARWHGGSHWGAGAERHRTTRNYWHQPHRWNELRSRGITTLKNGTPVPLWVFAGSMCDVFDNEVPSEWRADLWKTIRQTPHLRWQLVTKRVGNVAKMLPDDWTSPFRPDVQPPLTPSIVYGHVGVIATMVTQEEYDRDYPKLAALKEIGVKWIGLSIEPMLEPIDLLSQCPEHLPPDWVICGGESEQHGKCRPFDLVWARQLRDQCREAAIPFFMKQMGSQPIRIPNNDGLIQPFAHRAGADPTEWPDDLRIQEMPRVYHIHDPYAVAPAVRGTILEKRMSLFGDG